MTIAAVERFARRLSEEAANWRVALAQTEAALRLEIHNGNAALRLEMQQGFAAARQELHEGLASVRLEMRDGRFELLKWCFVFWVGQVFAVAGVVAIVLRLMQT